MTAQALHIIISFWVVFDYVKDQKVLLDIKVLNESHLLHFWVPSATYVCVRVCYHTKHFRLQFDNRNYSGSYWPLSQRIKRKQYLNNYVTLLSIMDLYNGFEDFLPDFRKHHNTEITSVKVINELPTAFDEGFFSVLVSLDLSTSFDSIDHHILLQRLECQIGIKGSTLSWFESRLAERYQFFSCLWWS